MDNITSKVQPVKKKIFILTKHQTRVNVKHE